MRSLKLTRPNTLVHAVTERLRVAIVNAELKLGEALSEEKLAASFEVSRTPVREALSLLQLQGLIEIAPQRGSFVFRPTPDDIERLCDFRIAMELAAAPLCARRAHASTTADLALCLEKMETAFAERDGLAYVTLDNDLHQVFFDHCGNKYFQDAYSLMSGRVAALRNNLSKNHPADQTLSLGEHRDIVHCFSERQMDRLGDILKVHIARTRQNFLNALDCGAFDAPKS